LRRSGTAALCGLVWLVAAPAWAATVCRIVVDADSGATLAREGVECDVRVSPASTFKIPLAITGYDAGALVDEHTPAWPYKPEYEAWRDSWKATIDPSSWLRESVVWYSQELTKRLGFARFKEAVDRLRYGNRDVTGDPGRNNGLTNAWLSSSLAISPTEQIAFLRKLLAHGLPFSKMAIDRTLVIMPTFPLADGWVARGKTGNDFLRKPDGERDRDRQFGWFVGWAEKNGRKLVFAELIRDDAKIEEPASLRARADILAFLPQLIAGRPLTFGESEK
jgi:beta-lactamase class D